MGSDGYDDAWLSHVRPAGYQNPAPRGRYNLLIIGAGTAGLVAANSAAALGARVALIERDRIGGERLESMLPRLILARAAHAVHQARRAAAFGVRQQEAAGDFAGVAERVRKVRAEIAANDDVSQLTEKGIDVYFGTATFVDGSHVTVGETELTFARALIATGASPALPDLPGIETVNPQRLNRLTALKELPRRLALWGTDATACEAAQTFVRLGSNVTVYTTGTRILVEEDEKPAHILQRALERDGVAFRFGCQNIELSAAQIRGHAIGGEFRDGFDSIIFVGRTHPNVAGLNLEAARVAFDESGILVNDRLRTTNSHVFAAGDVCAGYRFHHASDALARSVVANALFFSTSGFSTHTVPSLILTDPPLARLGINEADEDAKRYPVMELDFRDIDRALVDDESGFLRLYHDRRGGIHGATLIAAHAGEMIGELALAMRHRVRLSALAGDLHPYPTLSEVFRRAGDAYRHTLLTPSIARLIKRWLEWRR